MSGTQPSTWRTLIRGVLVQESSLTVGGAFDEFSPTDLSITRDGRGRPTIPGSSQAGCLVETLARLNEGVFRRNTGGSKGPAEQQTTFRRITGKTEGTPGGDDLLQSVLQFYPSHPQHSGTVELRQGVGIRQKTGATASQQQALYDSEAIPAGTRWGFLLEIDTNRGGPAVEALVLRGLLEWSAGRCWLGNSCARGTGWLRLDDLEAVRLPLTLHAVDAWPDNSCETTADIFHAACRIDGAVQISGADSLRGWSESAELMQPWHYLRLAVRLTPGARSDGYGVDALVTGGHTAATAEPLTDQLLHPRGMSADDYTDACDSDLPVVSTLRKVDSRRERHEPFLPGSGLRGPLRHSASRWHRGRQLDPNRSADEPSFDIPDPNDPDSPKTSDDPVSRLFGLLGHSARLLVRDGFSLGDWRLALLQNHAEDEFTAGVYGGSKFDRTAIISGAFETVLVFEAETAAELAAQVETLRPALGAAQYGFVPIGRAKSAGMGWLPWIFASCAYAAAGDSGWQEIPPAAWQNVLAGSQPLLELCGSQEQHHD